jgi:hypothetical protein
MDVAVLQPLDDLYDVMIYPHSHPIHMAARGRIERQHPEEHWPERVDAFFTRDITSAKPWEKVTAVQGGFLVARPDTGKREKKRRILQTMIFACFVCTQRLTLILLWIVPYIKTAVFDAYINFIIEGNYIGGRGDGKG